MLVRLYPAAKFVAIHYGHHQVTDNKVGLQLRDDIPCFLSVGSYLNGEIQTQAVFHEGNKIFVIIHNKHQGLLLFSGRFFLFPICPPNHFQRNRIFFGRFFRQRRSNIHHRMLDRNIHYKYAARTHIVEHTHSTTMERHKVTHQT